MRTENNYRIQARQAKAHFLTYDQNALIQKLNLEADTQYLYSVLLSRRYRIDRATGDMDSWMEGKWVDGNSFEEVMTMLDLVCDSREDRFISGRWKNMQDFGLRFHSNLLEDKKDPWARLFQQKPAPFCQALEALGGIPMPNGDIAYAVELFDGLSVMLQLWFGDDEFPPNLRFLWDENAWMYIRYETMYFARGLILSRIKEIMDCSF